MTPESLLEHLRSLALAYPETYEELPWGDRVAKVRNKMFAMYSLSKGHVHLTVKLPHSRESALLRSDTTPTGYGLGRSGWVSATLAPTVDRTLLAGWIEESFRVVAPRTLAREVPEGGPAPRVLPVPGPPAPQDAPLVLVVSDDVLRAERAAHGLTTRRVRSTQGTTDALDALADQPVAALLIDLGRSPAAALEIATQLAMIHFDGQLFLAGIRDAKSEAAIRVALPGAALYSRQPPGDPRVLEQVARAL